MDIKSLITQENVNLDDFVEHLKKHKISQKKYCIELADKRDFWNHNPIPFKGDIFRYLEENFVCRNNFQRWAARRASCSDLIKQTLHTIKMQHYRKGLNYIPSQVELRTMYAASITALIIKGLLFDYIEYCTNLGLQKRFDYNLTTTSTPFIENLKIIVDTREQDPFIFPQDDVEVSKLDFGDYYAPQTSGSLYVERKSLNDLLGTIGKDRVRFEKEIDRAREQDSYLVVLIEESLDQALQFKPKGKTRYLGGVGAMSIMRQLMQKHNNIQFIFCNGVKSATDTARAILLRGDKCKKLDLQYFYDKKQL